MWGKRAQLASIVIGVLALASSSALRSPRREGRRRASVGRVRVAPHHLAWRAPRYAIASVAAAASFFFPAVVISALLHVALIPLVRSADVFAANRAGETVVVSRLTLEGRQPNSERARPAPSVPPSVVSKPAEFRAAAKLLTRTSARAAFHPQAHVVLQVPVFRDESQTRSVAAVPVPPRPAPQVNHASIPSAATRSALDDVATPAPASAPVTGAVSEIARCAQPFTEARMLDKVVPKRPAIAEQQQAFGTAQIEVDLDERGAVRHAGVYVSSQNPSLDAAAIDAALRSTYAPRVANCRPTGGRYVYIVDFSP